MSLKFWTTPFQSIAGEYQRSSAFAVKRCFNMNHFGSTHPVEKTIVMNEQSVRIFSKHICLNFLNWFVIKTHTY